MTSGMMTDRYSIFSAVTEVHRILRESWWTLSTKKDRFTNTRNDAIRGRLLDVIVCREFTERIVYAFIVEMYATSVKMYETIEWKYMIYGASLKVCQLKLIWILNKWNQSRNGTMDKTMHANLIEIVVWLK